MTGEARHTRTPTIPLDLAKLFDDHQRPLLGLILRITGDLASAEDALQETFVSAVRAAPAFRADAAPSTWLYRIAVREGVHARARAHRDRMRAAERIHRDDRAPPGLGRAEWVEQTEHVLRALDMIPDEQRLALVLLSVHELTADEIATMLGVPAATVYTRAFRAREQLRTLLTRNIEVQKQRRPPLA